MIEQLADAENRRLFERWAVSKKLPIMVSDNIINRGAYANGDTHVAWLAWQGALAAMEGQGK